MRVICRNLQISNLIVINGLVTERFYEADGTELHVTDSNVKKNNTIIILMIYRIDLKHEKYKYISISDIL